MNTQLTRYRGELSHEQLAFAYDKTIANAKGLLEDAQVLFEKGKYPRAHYLLCICNEEIGK